MTRRGLLICALPPALSIALMGEVRADTPELPRTMRLEYVRGPGAQECPAEDTLRFAIAGRMAVKPFAADAPARLVVTIRRKGGLLEGAAEVRGPADEALWSFATVLPECHLVMDSLAIAIGLALDPPVSKKKQPEPEAAEAEKVEAAPEVEKKEPAKVEPAKVEAPLEQPAPTPPKDLPPDPKPAKPLPERVRWMAGLGAAAAMRTSPASAALDLMVGGEMRWRWFSLGAEVRYSPPAMAAALDLAPDPHGEVRGAGVTASRLVGGIAPCGHAGVFLGCAVVQVGALFGGAVGVTKPIPVTIPTVAGGGRIGLDVPFGGRFLLRPTMDLLATGFPTVLRIDLRSQWVKPAFSMLIGGCLFAEF